MTDPGSESIYRAVFENTGSGTVIIREDTVILHANAEFARLVGYSKEEIEGKQRWTSFIVPEDLERMMEQHKMRRSDPRAAQKKYEFRFRRRDGEIRNIFLAADLIPGTTMSVATLMDITEQKRAEAALAGSEKKYRAVFETSRDAIMMLDEKGFFDCNEATLKLFGFSGKSEFIGIHPGKLSPARQPDGRDSISAADERIKTAYAQGVCFFEWMHARRDGTPFPADVLISGMEMDGRPVVQAVVRDISERKKAQEQSARLSAMEAVGQLAAGMAHEINNPLGIILGFAQSISRRVKEDDPLFQPVAAIIREGLRTRDLVAKLQVFATSFQSKIYDSLCLAGIVEKAVSLTAERVEAAGLRLNKELSSDLPELKTNSVQIQQVVLHLIDNAVDATPKGGDIWIRAHISRKSPGYVEIQIQDSGKGIPREIQSRIFDPFFSTKTGGPGVGLGLTVASEIVRQHSGRIELESDIGKGSLFTVYLPVAGG